MSPGLADPKLGGTTKEKATNAVNGLSDSGVTHGLAIWEQIQKKSSTFQGKAFGKREVDVRKHPY
jgi:hypothetical protein